MILSLQIQSSVLDRHDARIRKARTLGRGVNIIFLTILLEPHVSEAETFELFGVFVRFRVLMCLCRIDTDCSSLRNTGAIGECVILPGNSRHDDCFCQRKAYTE